MGGMGQVLTALTAAQQRTSQLQVAILLPFYSYLKDIYHVKRVVDLSIDVQGSYGSSVPVKLSIYAMTYALVPNSTLATEQVTVYLVGPGHRFPFKRAFMAETPIDIYSSAKELPSEWKDLYFLKAASALLGYLSMAKHEQPLFAPFHPHEAVQVVHLHGATNAYLAHFIRDMVQTGQWGPTPPAIVYTLHDYLDELQYSNTVANVLHFGTASPAYTRGHCMFMSNLAIDEADAVTFVSRSMAADIVEGRIDFYLKELVMDSLLRKTYQGRFFGISNGVDFTILDPFHHPQLKDPSHYASTSKSNAKRFLMEHHCLTLQDMTRPLVLYVGRFQYNKGLAMFEQAMTSFVKHNMRLVIIGQPNNYPLARLEVLVHRFPDHSILLSTPQDQDQWLVHYRAAADFVFVPSLTESFGLVAVEGLSFGAAVISTGVGGLKEFLVDRTAGDKHNAFLFKPPALEEAILDAAVAYAQWQSDKARREVHVLQMMQSAFVLGWDQGGVDGPVYDYMRVYSVALANRQNSKGS
ncbi:hypothetical protein BDF14DRAFT_1731541 [Spinellus fusiger]|nr:hypothetical protein BDF14DRAFT_1731541 [Spinellus fusiger]